MRARQRENEAEMQRLEKESWERCLKVQAPGQASSEKIEAMLRGKCCYFRTPSIADPTRY